MWNLKSGVSRRSSSRISFQIDSVSRTGGRRPLTAGLARLTRTGGPRGRRPLALGGFESIPAPEHVAAVLVANRGVFSAALIESGAVSASGGGRAWLLYPWPPAATRPASR